MPQRSGSFVGRVLDVASDWAVLWFATWTLLAYVGMLTGAAATLLVWLWLATVPLVGAALTLLGRETPVRRENATAPQGPRLAIVGIGCGVLFGLLIALGDRVPWPIVWAPAALAVVVALARGHLTRSPAQDEARPGLAADLTAAAFALVLAVMSLFVDNSNADDAFYVNRATATAQLNRIPVKDVLFTHEQVGPISGAGLPVDALHALQGAVARFAGLEAPTVAYLVTTPIATFLATWALWRLLRAWAPRFALLCFALGVVYWVWSATTELSAGSFFLSRLWQGKVIFVAWMVPTLYLLLTRWIRRPHLRAAVMLLAAGLASIGLTGSATFVAPLVFAAAALPLVARREWGPLALVVAAAAIPFLIGAGVSSHYELSDEIGGNLHDNYWIFTEVLATGAVGAIGAAALWSGPWLARSGGIVTGIAVITALLLAPGVLDLLSDAVGLTDTLRRLFWLAPVPALVGLLAAAPRHRLAAAAVALVVAAMLVVFGRPVWVALDGRPTWNSPPAWKVNRHFLGEARLILERYDGSGAILAAKKTMRAIVIVTAEPKAVNARSYYARLLPEPRRRIRERLALTRLATQGRSPRSTEYVRSALEDLDVGLVCLPADKPQLAAQAGLTAGYRRAFTTSAAYCLVRRG